MKTLLTMILLVMGALGNLATAQDELSKGLDKEVFEALQKDDLDALKKVLDTASLNECYGEDHVLVCSIRLNAFKCFNYLLTECKPNLNLVCGSGKAPIYLAAKYGRLEMLKTLVKKGADIKLKYRGGDLMTYSLKYPHKEILDYIRSITEGEKKKLPVVVVDVN